MDFFTSNSTSGINYDIQKAIDQLSKLYTLTGSTEFKAQMDSVVNYVKELPDEKCEEWGINKKQFDVQPTPLPTEELYGLLQVAVCDKYGHDTLEIFNPHYTVRIFKNLEEARRTEASSIIQFRNSIGPTHKDGTNTYHPTLYKIKFEPI